MFYLIIILMYIFNTGNVDYISSITNLLLSFITDLCVPLSSFILTVPIHKCWGQLLCMSFTFSVAMLNSTCVFHMVK